MAQRGHTWHGAGAVMLVRDLGTSFLDVLCFPSLLGSAWAIQDATSTEKKHSLPPCEAEKKRDGEGQSSFQRKQGRRSKREVEHGWGKEGCSRASLQTGLKELRNADAGAMDAQMTKVDTTTPQQPQGSCHMQLLGMLQQSSRWLIPPLRPGI